MVINGVCIFSVFTGRACTREDVNKVECVAPEYSANYLTAFNFVSKQVISALCKKS